MNKELDMLGDYIRDLEATNKELNDNTTWWANRFNAVQRDYEELKKRNKELEDGFKASIEELSEYATKIDKAIEYIKWQYENPTYDNVWRKYEVEKLLEILGDKENE